MQLEIVDPLASLQPFFTLHKMVSAKNEKMRPKTWLYFDCNEPWPAYFSFGSSKSFFPWWKNFWNTFLQNQYVPFWFSSGFRKIGFNFCHLSNFQKIKVSLAVIQCSGILKSAFVSLYLRRNLWKRPIFCHFCEYAMKTWWNGHFCQIFTVAAA